MNVALQLATATADGRPERTEQITGPRHIDAVKTLRISVTDRCNFRCVYCMPEEKLDWVPKPSLLTFEEIGRVAEVAHRHGIAAFKITGGEPLVRHDLPSLVSRLKRLPGGPEISMTTNGSLLHQQAGPLRAAGLDRLTVSLDTLDADRFSEITRGAKIASVWRGIEAAVEGGFGPPKLNCVVMRGINDGELAEFAALTLDRAMTVRFIEYMPLGRTALGGEYEKRFMGEAAIRDLISRRHGPLEQASKDAGAGPARVWRIAGAAGKIGFISAMSKPFCEDCNRLRLTAEGVLRSCLFDGGEVSLRPILRSAAGDDTAEALRAAFVRCVAFKPDEHARRGYDQMSALGG